jgi:hypothetical protein
VAGGAVAWRQLPQLRGLFISFDEQAPLPSQMAAIVDAIAACTLLTSLHIEASESLSGKMEETQPVRSVWQVGEPEKPPGASHTWGFEAGTWGRAGAYSAHWLDRACNSRAGVCSGRCSGYCAG